MSQELNSFEIEIWLHANDSLFYSNSCSTVSHCLGPSSFPLLDWLWCSLFIFIHLLVCCDWGLNPGPCAQGECAKQTQSCFQPQQNFVLSTSLNLNTENGYISYSSHSCDKLANKRKVRKEDLFVWLVPTVPTVPTVPRWGSDLAVYFLVTHGWPFSTRIVFPLPLHQSQTSLTTTAAQHVYRGPGMEGRARGMLTALWLSHRPLNPEGHNCGTKIGSPQSLPLETNSYNKPRGNSYPASPSKAHLLPALFCYVPRAL